MEHEKSLQGTPIDPHHLKETFASAVKRLRDKVLRYWCLDKLSAARMRYATQDRCLPFECPG
jgi:hypothetical protein